MQHFFIAIYSFFSSKKILAIAIFISILLFLGFFASKTSFSEDITRLIPTNDKTNTTAKVLNQMNFSDKITIIISSKKKGTPEDLSQVANAFLNALEKNCKGYVGQIQGKLDDENLQETFNFVYDNLPLFLDQKDYISIQNKLQNDSIAKIVQANYKSLISPTGIVSRDFILKDPLGISFIALKKLQQLSVGDDFLLQDGFVVTKDKKNLLLFITPKLPPNETDKNTIFIERLNKIRQDLNTKYSDKTALSFFGATPVAVANATQIKADVQWTSIFAGVVLILILAFFYRNITTPLLIFIPSLFGAIFALTVLYFTRGSISAISLGISSILLGETTDYSIYVLTHLRNHKDVKLLYKDISKPLLLCGITTAITFLCLFFVKSEALKDLGIFAALSVVATAVFSLVLIPLLYKTDKKVVQPKSNIIDKLSFYNYHKNKFLVIIVAVFLIVCCFTYSKVTFNNDLSALNFVPQDLKQTEKKLEDITSGDSKSIYIATYGDSYESVLKNNNTVFNTLTNDKKSAQIVNFSSIGGIVFSTAMQNQKIQQWNNFWDNAKKTALKASLIKNGLAFGFKSNSYYAFYENLDKKFENISIDDYAKVKSFFINEFVAQKKGFYTISSLVKVSKEKRDIFVNNIKKLPNLVVIDRVETNETFLGNLKRNFEDLINYSFIAIFFILLLAFKRIELVIISMIPILVSWIFTTGLMGMFGIQFNVINIIVCTLIFGIGVDYSIFMTTALQKEHTNGSIQLPTYRTSIMLSVATTILGIGVLVFAKHPALRSISIIAIIGIFSSLLITFIIQPLVFNFFVTNRVKKGLPPFEIKRLIHSTLSFIYYGLGGFILSIVSVALIKILPFSKKSKLRTFHAILSKFMHSVLLTYPSNKKTVINKHNEKFNKQAVIIANHTSFLDILAVGMLSPKIIFLVSDWVYNSPIFGKGVRLAGFYPVSSGIDNGVEHLRSKVEQGFSLMVFPEGTRSEENTIKRFHKGAFFLADQFQLDIIPVVIHGYSEVLPKGDFMINGGKTSVEILERITPEDTVFGNNFAERTKKVSSFFKVHYKKMRHEIEDVNYFKKMLFNSFDYKELPIIKTVKDDFNTNADLYYQLNKHIAEKAKILHLADDYGQLDVLLTLQESTRKVSALIIDNEKRAVAKTNYIVKKRAIHYIDSLEIGLQSKYDVILISDKNSDKSIEKLVSSSNTIILVSNPNLKNKIINLGFDLYLEDSQIIILHKKVT
jgi:uncharacterized protein